MEKYAVVQEIEKITYKDRKCTRLEDALCSKCKSVIEFKGQIRWCPECGTEPFEKHKVSP